MARRVVPGATDTQCGFKFFSGPLARAAAQRLTTPGFAFDIELIALCQRLGASLTEFPVHWRDMPGSTFSVPRHSARGAPRRGVHLAEPPARPRGRAGARCPGPHAGAARRRCWNRRARHCLPGSRRRERAGCPRRSRDARRPPEPRASASPQASAAAASSGAPGIPATGLTGLTGLRIAIVNWRDPWHPDAGGAERYAWEIGRGLADRGRGWSS